MTPEVADAEAFAPEFAAALGAADVAAVLLRLAASDERAKINKIKTLAPIAQDRGVALLVEGEAPGTADGAHLVGIEAFLTAVETLKPAGRIAGCGGLATRHDAMVAAERGADYVMFGDAPHGRRPPFGAILERVGWWSELFEIACVAAAQSPDEIGPLAAAGADFVAAGDFIWSDRRGAAAALADAARQLGAPEAAA